ncbi:MAG TPA: fibronectin type III domain-containing protein [Kofleriaceae bacterium]|nr:fibronectin type III domain-containing protein [Kofleriaceae bacterium]
MFPRLAACLLAAAALVPFRPAAAAEQCRVVDVDFQPSDKLQIVAWIEDAQGHYVDTIFITDGIGRRGLGNRPGRFDFNSGPRWPYGRRITTFPIWSNRHGMDFPTVVYQNGDESNLSHPFNQSSQETFFCRPLRTDEAGWDTGTCASPIFTDKGKLDLTHTTKYPPREDITRVEGVDDAAVDMYDAMNGFDAVSTATPPADLPYTISWPIPDAMGEGDYVLWVEVAKEFDDNQTYNANTYPSPAGIPWSEYGLPYRGQPSVVYKVPFTVSTDATTTMTSDYVGYGDPDGLDGNVRAPDATISTSTPGSGAARLLLRTDGADSFRLRVVARPESDSTDPDAPSDLHSDDLTQTTATVSFTAPSDGNNGRVSGYEIRYRAGDPITDANFATSTPIAQAVVPEDPGSQQDFDLTGLLPQTDYYVGIRAFDDCKNYSPMQTLKLTTPARTSGEVDACFVATAAYGSLLANEVANLRSFRDGYLRRSVLGELFVESYYSIGPAFAAAIDPSDPLREAARAGLAPLVDAVKGLKFEE